MSCRSILAVLLTLTAIVPAGPAHARESLGVFEGWAAFRDRETPRCYAIAVPQPVVTRHDFQPYASIGTWPRAQLRNQLHIRLLRNTRPQSHITLAMGSQRFALLGGGGNAWAADRRMDAAIVAAMRSAPFMTVSATDDRGNRFSSTYALAGAATAMDAATIGCNRLR